MSLIGILLRGLLAVSILSGCSMHPSVRPASTPLRAPGSGLELIRPSALPSGALDLVVFGVEKDLVSPLMVLPNGSHAFAELSPGCHILGNFPLGDAFKSSFGVVNIQQGQVLPVSLRWRFDGGTLMTPSISFAFVSGKDTVRSDEDPVEVASASALSSVISESERTDILMQLQMAQISSRCE